MRTYLITLLFIVLPLAGALPQLGTDDVLIYQAYPGQPLLAWSSLPPGEHYAWRVDGTILKTGTTDTTLLLHFDNDLNGTQGEEPLQIEEESYEPGLFGAGFTGRAYYQEADNLDLETGTIDIWLTALEPLNSSVYDAAQGGDPYIFRHRNNSLDESFYLYIRSSSSMIGFVAYNGSWPNAAQLGTSRTYLDGSQSHLITITYDQEENRSAFYLDGMKISEGRYDFHFTPNEQFFIGNPHVLIHELRFKNTTTTQQEVKANYERGIPFSDNDITLDYDLQPGQQVDLMAGPTLDQMNVAPPPLSIISPPKHTTPYTESIIIEVQSDHNDCRYSSQPRLYTDMTPLIRDGNNHAASIPVESIIDPITIFIKCSDDYAQFRRIRVLPPVDNNYPKLFIIYWGQQINETTAEDISRFDMIGVGAAYIYQSRIIREVKSYHDHNMFSYYDNMIAVSPHHGFWEKDFYREVGDAYRLQNSEGTFAYNPSFEKNLMQNLYVPLDYAEAQSRQADYLMNYGYFDQTWYDNAGSSFWFLRNYSLPGSPYIIYPDIDLDGVDENLDDPDDAARAIAYWKEGINEIVTLTREAYGGGSIITGNGVDYYPEDWNGKLWEEEMSRTEYGLTLNDFLDEPTGNSAAMRHNFRYWQNNTQEPRFNQNLYSNNYAYGTSSFYRSHRYGLAASIIGGVYYGTAQRANRQFIWWFDEYWVNTTTGQSTTDVSGRGWLGAPIAEPVKVADDVYYREFERGIAIASGVATTVDLPTTFRRINGDQDPSNDGSLISTIDLSARDGAVLVRARCDNNPGNDPLCITIPCALAGDLNCDGYVTLADMHYLESHYGLPGQDLDGDGFLGMADFLLLGRLI